MEMIIGRAQVIAAASRLPMVTVLAISSFLSSPGEARAGLGPAAGGEATPAEATTDEAPEEVVPAPAPAPSESALPDSAWRALVGSKVVLTRSDGATLSGELLEVDETTATVVLEDGTLAPAAKADIVKIRKADAAEPAKPTADAKPGESEVQSDKLAADKRPMSEHRGFYLAGAVGFGMPISWAPYRGVGEPYDGTERSMGPGANLGFAIGGAPAPGFVLGFDLDTNVGVGSYEDEYIYTEGGDYDGFNEYDGRSHTIGSSLFLQGYIKNFFIRGGFGGMGLFFINDGSSDHNYTTGGMGFEFALGAHWPLAAKAALGFSAGLRGAFWRYDDEDYEGSVNILQPMVRLEMVVF